MQKNLEPDHVSDLGQAVARFMSDGIEQLPTETQQAVAQAIADGAAMRCQVDIDGLGTYAIRGLIVEDAHTTELFTLQPRTN